MKGISIKNKYFSFWGQKMEYEDLFLWVVLMELDIADLDDFLISRKQENTLIRQYLYSLLREKGLTFKHIGRIFKKDHTSILSALKRHRNDIEIGYSEYLIIKEKIDNKENLINFINSVYKKKEL